MLNQPANGNGGGPSVRPCMACGAPATRVLLMAVPLIGHPGEVYRWLFPLVTCKRHATPIETDKFFDPAWTLARSTQLALLSLPAADFDATTFEWLSAAEVYREVGQTQGLAVEQVGH